METTNPLADVSFKDLSRVAAYLGNGIYRESGYSETYHEETVRATLMFAIYKVLCELKEFGQLKSHPDSLIQRSAAVMQAYHYRGHPHMLDWLCRAFARQFGNFDGLPPIEQKTWWRDWEFYGYSGEPTIKYDERAAHKIFINRATTLKNFGKWVVCECYPAKFTEIAGLGGMIVSKWEVVEVIPFNSYNEAVLFITQLAELLDTGDEVEFPAATQFIRDVVAQAPVEKMQMALEREAAERAEREKKERIINSSGTNVYVLDFGNGLIKIGVSCNVRSRISQANTFGQITVRFAVTQKHFSYGEACKIEHACHDFFKDKRVTKEVFRVPYDEAKAKLETYSPVIEFDK